MHYKVIKMSVLAGKCTMNELLEVMTKNGMKKRNWFLLICVIGRNSDILKLVLIMPSNCIEVFCISFIAL